MKENSDEKRSRGNREDCDHDQECGIFSEREKEAILMERPYAGVIKVGDLFTWEPTLCHAREEVVVVRIDEREGDERIIWCRNSERPMHMYFNKTVWNEEGRFREAAVPSRLKIAFSPLKDWETLNPHAKLAGPWPDRMSIHRSRRSG